MLHHRIVQRLIVVGGVVLLLALLVIFGLFTRMQYEIHQDVEALHRPLSLLQRGQALSSVLAVLESKSMSNALRSRGYRELEIDEGFTQVAHFDPAIGESQTYQSGRALYSYAETKDGTRSMHIWCYFTTYGALTRVDSGVQQANTL